MIVVVGLSYRSAPVEVRERLAIDKTRLPEVLHRLRERAELTESLFLSTCNRVEVFAYTDTDPFQASRAIREVLAHYAAVEPGTDIGAFLYEKQGDDAARHIFRVSSSLDSMVLGEPQILGQVKDAYDVAASSGNLGSFLGRCVTRSFSVAKRVRTETAIGAGNVSISSVAVDLAKDIFGDLKEHVVLLLGAGEMAEAAAKSLGKGAKGIHICNRSFERAVALAKDLDADVARWESLESELATADVVVASTGSPHYVVTPDMVKRAMKVRRGRTLFFVDIAVPRNVDPKIHEIDNAYVYDVDDLEKQVAESMKSREGEATAATRIIDEELDEFWKWAQGLNVQPTIIGLRTKTRAVLLSELDRSLAGRLKHLADGDREALRQMMESATNKLLHSTVTKLRKAAGAEHGADFARVLKELFDLPEISEADRIRPSMPPPTDSMPAPADSLPAPADGDKRITH